MKRKFGKRIVALLTVFVMMLSFSLQPVFAAEANPDVELTLLVGDTELDVSNFVYDVQTAVYNNYNISSDRLNINIAGTETIDTKSDFNWTIYDNYYSPDYPISGEEPVNWAVYNSQPYFYYEEDDPEDASKYFTDVSFEDDSLSYCNNRSKHIYPKDNDLVFVGYSSLGFNDFMVYPDQNTGDKVIQFSIDESGVSTHTLEGAGFLFNASIEENLLNGYLVFYNYINWQVELYRLTDVDAVAFHQADTLIDYLAQDETSGITLIASKDIASEAEIKDIKVQTTANSLKFYEDDVVIFDTNSEEDSNIVIEDTGAGGFGPLVSYASHWCDELSYFTFKNLAMVTTKPVTLLDLVNNQTWNENSKHIIVNVDDAIDFFDNETLSEIANQLKENDVHYIGWGQNTVVADAVYDEVADTVYNADVAEELIGLNDNQGIFINLDDPSYDSYDKGIDAIAKYINDLLVVTQPPAEESDDDSDDDDSDTTPAEPEIVTFIDVLGHWAQSDIEKLATAGFINGYPNGTFQPEGSVTRAEFAELLANVFEAAELEQGGNVVEFYDVAADDWFYDAVSLLASEDIIRGYDDGTFKPDKLISREEATAMLVRLLTKMDVAMETNELTFTDSDQISDWARADVAKMVSLGIIQGMPDGSFQPADNSTRAEAAVMILRLLEKTDLL